MIKIALATQNKGKVKEITKIFSLNDVEIYVPSNLAGILGPETGKTFKENAEQKALAVARATGDYAIADDSGLEVDELDGRPGVRSARYSGESATDIENVEKLLEEMAGVTQAARTARFVCAASLAGPSGVIVTKLGHVEGIIGERQTGGGGFGYDPVFIPKGYSLTMAQISSQEKNNISHRGKAFRALAESIGSLTELD